MMVYAVPSFGHQPHKEKGEKNENHKSVSLHYTDNTIYYLYSPVISYHGAVCKHGFEGASSISSYTRTQNKYCLRQESFRKTIKSILTSHSSAHQFLMLPDNLSFMSKMKALSIAIFLISEFPVINP